MFWQCQGLHEKRCEYTLLVRKKEDRTEEDRRQKESIVTVWSIWVLEALAVTAVTFPSNYM